MQKDDARKLDHATLEALRIRAVRSVQDGESPERLKMNPHAERVAREERLELRYLMSGDMG